LSEPGSRLLEALAEQSIRNGCGQLRLDLADVTAVDTAGLLALRQLRVALPLAGVHLRVNESRPHLAESASSSITAAAASVENP
jgi:anti-anti-sigma regulatory factor